MNRDARPAILGTLVGVPMLAYGVWGVLAKGPSRELSGWMTQILFTFALAPSVIFAARSIPATVSACRKGVPGATKLAPGRWSPMNSISIWLVFAVP